VLRSKKEAKIVYRYLKSAYENLDIVGVYSMDTGVTEEALVNEINTKSSGSHFDGNGES